MFLNEDEFGKIIRKIHLGKDTQGRLGGDIRRAYRDLLYELYTMKSEKKKLFDFFISNVDLITESNNKNVIDMAIEVIKNQKIEIEKLRKG
jgi:hypothetical protein